MGATEGRPLKSGGSVAWCAWQQTGGLLCIKAEVRPTAWLCFSLHAMLWHMGTHNYTNRDRVFLLTLIQWKRKYSQCGVKKKGSSSFMVETWHSECLLQNRWPRGATKCYFFPPRFCTILSQHFLWWLLRWDLLCPTLTFPCFREDQRSIQNPTATKLPDTETLKY